MLATTAYFIFGLPCSSLYCTTLAMQHSKHQVTELYYSVSGVLLNKHNMLHSLPQVLLTL